MNFTLNKLKSGLTQWNVVIWSCNKHRGVVGQEPRVEKC